MKLILFDLGDTLEAQDVLLPGAHETLRAIRQMRDGAGDPAVLCLVSDFAMPDGPDQVPVIRRRYYDILDGLGIRAFFEPVSERVTLSTEVGAFKPDARVFRCAVDKIDPTLGLGDALFITENREHVREARTLGLQAIHFKGPGQVDGEVEQLADLLPLVEKFLAGADVT